MEHLKVQVCLSSEKLRACLKIARATLWEIFRRRNLAQSRLQFNVRRGIEAEMDGWRENLKLKQNK